ncbi:MAG TPA: amidohydrolase, partial [Arenimonas sp.]|nr:amidohydrolase [Arenimonas sp.]
MKRLLLSLALATAFGHAAAQDVLIRNATVHTGTSAGRIDNGDVLVRDGRIAAVGARLDAPEGIASIDAKGRALTPALFAGITAIGLEEVSGEQPTVDGALTLGLPESGLIAQMRPEFDVTLAFNPRSMLIPVVRTEGLGFTVLGASSVPGGSLVGGQGGVARLDGGFEAPLADRRLLFVDLGAGASELSGNSRAAQWMLLEQAAREARTP